MARRHGGREGRMARRHGGREGWTDDGAHKRGVRDCMRLSCKQALPPHKQGTGTCGPGQGGTGAGRSGRGNTQKTIPLLKSLLSALV